MMAAEPARQPGGSARAMPAGLRTTVAIGLLVLAAGDLAAVDALLLPRYLASRGRASPALATAAATRVVATLAVPAPAGPPPPAGKPPPTAVPEVVAPTAAAAALATPPQQPQIEPLPPSWPRLQFGPNKAWLSAKARETLADLAAQLRQNPQLHVVLVGHTDDAGPADLNQALSLDRARRARAWLLARGAAPAQLTVRALGSSQPLVMDRSAQARAQNRRVEITVREKTE